MSASEWILVITALIALSGVFVSYQSVKNMAGQVDLQKQQWEFSHKPVFRIDKLPTNNDHLILVNEKENFFIIESVSFTNRDIEISYNGLMGMQPIKTRGDEKTYGDYKIIVPIKIDYKGFRGYTEGIIQITGIDFLGNQFKCNSPQLKFENMRPKNDMYLTHSYFRNI
ncbi:hypothetical protein [Sporosarcina sp. NPDC096371]|uniref:hypothetical protein n=1 Tax=Sporosarcina sp. NPDC096371 TaxID=3364530 RepID=UPI0037F8BA4C